MNLAKRKNLHLTLVRHGESIWNQKNLFTGWENVNLTENGVNEASNGGKLLAERNINYNIGYTSFLNRAQETYRLILQELKAKGGNFHNKS
jgi:2,3-bisphosphoglycerate-dependent phosphoglycerate mutase